MLLLEAICLVIVAVFLVAALARTSDRRGYLRRFAVLAAGSWLAEASCIRLYGFYSYSPDWIPFLDVVPLPIVLIWPVVILSAGELVRCLLGEDHRLLPVAGGALVLTDASLVEPIAVRAGLWTWSEPGIFGVPPIGVFGWAFFAGVCIAFFAANERRRRSPWADLALPLVAPAATHVALIGAWWGAARWTSVPLPAWATAAVAWTVSATLLLLAIRSTARRRIPPAALLTRIPAAAFFYTLLALHGRGQPPLVVYALAFSPPYVALIDWRRLLSVAVGSNKDPSPAPGDETTCLDARTGFCSTSARPQGEHHEHDHREDGGVGRRGQL
jgi:hypothetical protein